LTSEAGASRKGSRPAHDPCPSCGLAGLEVFYEQRGVPSHSCLLLQSPDEARAFPKGDIRLGLCQSCGFITNTAYDPTLQAYSERFEESQGFSPRFREFAEELAGRIVEKYGLHGKTVLEIGCGKGEFLALICEIGEMTGVGIDPAFIDNRLEGEVRDRVSFIPEFFSDKHAHLVGDLVLCRHTLEHIPDTAAFLHLVRRSIRSTDTVVVFELPDAGRVLREAAFWDIYYEHCSYFTPGSLLRLFRLSGFDVLDVGLDYDDQYILIEARASVGEPSRAASELEDTPEGIAEAIESFQEKLSRRKTELEKLGRGGRRTVIWGAQSKGVAFLTTLEMASEIEYAVDINPFKHDTYMAGTGQRVVAPEFLREYQPELVVAMNPIYLDEIQKDLDRLGVRAELTAV